MNEKTNKCPHCGASPINPTEWECGSLVHDLGYEIVIGQSDCCKLNEKTNEVVRLESLVKELKENAERIGCNRFEALCKAEAKNRDLLETLAAIYEKLGIKEENVKPKELVSDTIANLFKEKSNEVARPREEVDLFSTLKCVTCKEIQEVNIR